MSEDLGMTGGCRESGEGEGMSGWTECTLSEVADVIPGFAFKGEHFGERGVTVIKIKDITPPTISVDGAQKVDLANYSISKLEKFKLKKGDYVVAMTGATIGKVGKLLEETVVYINQRVAKIEAKSGVDQDFIYFSLIDGGFDAFIQNNIDSHSAQENISGTSIGRYPIALPQPPDQKAIAAVLSSLDDKIDLLHRQNQTLEAMAATLFRQWFVEEAQEDWEQGSLGEVVDIFDGKRIPLSKMEREKKKEGILYPYYGAAQIMDYINDYIFDGEYILLGEDGTVRTDEGYPVLQYATGKFWVNNHTHVLQAKAPYSNFFLWNYLSRTNIDEIVTGAVQPKINQGNLKSLLFPRFTKSLIVEFNEITEPVLAKIQHNKTQIAGLENLRDTLLPKLMSGEVRVAV